MGAEYALTFDSVVDAYRRGRPGYPDLWYRTVRLYRDFPPDSTILEVGAGHGVATREIHRTWPAHITALEPGARLAAALRTNLPRQIAVENTTFEDFRTDLRFDAIFSATAFHWLDPESKFERAYELLNPDGLLVVYWNNYSIRDVRVHGAIQRIYDAYHPTLAAVNDWRTVQERTISSRKDEIRSTGYFDFLGHHEIAWRIPYDGARYVELLRSFSHNAALTGPAIATFYQKIGDYIAADGDTIDVDIVTNGAIARRVDRNPDR